MIALPDESARRGVRARCVPDQPRGDAVAGPLDMTKGHRACRYPFGHAPPRGLLGFRFVDDLQKRVRRGFPRRPT